MCRLEHDTRGRCETRTYMEAQTQTHTCEACCGTFGAPSLHIHKYMRWRLPLFLRLPSCCHSFTLKACVAQLGRPAWHLPQTLPDPTCERSTMATLPRQRSLRAQQCVALDVSQKADFRYHPEHISQPTLCTHAPVPIHPPQSIPLDNATV